MTTVTQKIPSGYKQTEIGVIPVDWDIKMLGDIGECLIGLTYKPSDVSHDGMLVLRSSNIQNDKLSFEDNVYVDVDVPEKIKVKKGDILICVRNGSRNLIGKCALLDSRVEGQTFGAFMAVFRTPYYNYIFHQFQSNNIQRQINENIGATINQITNKNLNSFRIAFPHKEEERSIISNILSDAEALTEKLEKLIEKKKNIKQGTMQDLITGKLRLPGFSGEWNKQKLASLGSFRGGSGFPLRYQGNKEGDYPFYKVSDMNNEGNSTFMFDSNHWVSEAIRKQSGANIFPANTIVFAKIGAAIFLERKKILSQVSCIDNNMMGFILNEAIANSRFVHYLFHNIKLGKLVSATALPSLNGKEIGELIFGIPELPEQTAIATVLSDMDTEIEKLESQLTKYKNIKQGMMQTLLTGKIRLLTK